MRVRVRLFASLREVAGAPFVDLDLPEEARAQDAVDELVRRHPRLAPYRPHTMVAVRGAFAPPTAPLRDGDEVALMPPVSGGGIHAGAFSLDELVASLERRGAGAVVAFVGLVRETSGEAAGARVERLSFEAYAPLAEAAIAQLEAEARAKFGLRGVVVAHRVETLQVGEPIVAVVTAAPHRREAFEAAAWIMDELKTRVPIWKKEEGPDGARWVNDPTSARARTSEDA